MTPNDTMSTPLDPSLLKLWKPSSSQKTKIIMVAASDAARLAEALTTIQMHAMKNKSSGNLSRLEYRGWVEDDLTGHAIKLEKWSDGEIHILDEDDPADREPTGYYCMCCGHLQEHAPDCERCMGPVEEF